MGDRLKDKVALVSGAGSSGPGWGNGKATAVLFAREGAKVLAADLNLDAAVETKQIIESEGGICETVAGNVSRADDVVAMVDMIGFLSCQGYKLTLAFTNVQSAHRHRSQASPPVAAPHPRRAPGSRPRERATSAAGAFAPPLRARAQRTAPSRAATVMPSAPIATTVPGGGPAGAPARRGS